MTALGQKQRSRSDADVCLCPDFLRKLPSRIRFSNQTTRAPERLEDVRADGFLLRELQLAQRAVADVVVGDVSARVVDESADAVLGTPATRLSVA